jgi:hypothetical protein
VDHWEHIRLAGVELSEHGGIEECFCQAAERLVSGTQVRDQPAGTHSRLGHDPQVTKEAGANQGRLSTAGRADNSQESCGVQPADQLLDLLFPPEKEPGFLPAEGA